MTLPNDSHPGWNKLEAAIENAPEPVRRYEVRPHKHNVDFPHDGGYALWDTVANKQTGWFRDRDRCAERVDQENKYEAFPKA